MKFSSTIVALGALRSVWGLWSLPTEAATECPPVSGDILINQYQLYPENLFYDTSSCKLLIGALYNSSVYVYDLETKTGSSITFENLTLDPSLHISGVRKNPLSGLLSVVINAGAAFTTGHVTGDNWLIQYDLTSNTEVSRVNLAETTQGVYGGYQDLEFDSAGNMYVVGTFPTSILKVDPSGLKVEVWYLPPPVDHTIKGFSGLAVVGNTLLANDEVSGNILRFDLTAATGTPTVVHHSPSNATINDRGDGIVLPAKFHGTVLLIAQNMAGLSVLRSNDLWVTAEYLGVITMPTSVGNGLVTTAVQIMGSVYANIAYFFDTPIGRNRTEFPLIDITAALDALLL